MGWPSVPLMPHSNALLTGHSIVLTSDPTSGVLRSNCALARACTFSSKSIVPTYCTRIVSERISSESVKITRVVGTQFYVKSPVFPWNKFAGVDTVLGPEMKSTGEVMGVANTFGEAFAKAQLAAGQVLPTRFSLPN